MFKDIPVEEIKELVNTKASIAIINANIKDKYNRLLAKPEKI